MVTRWNLKEQHLDAHSRKRRRNVNDVNNVQLKQTVHLAERNARVVLYGIDQIQILIWVSLAGISDDGPTSCITP